MDDRSPRTRDVLLGELPTSRKRISQLAWVTDGRQDGAMATELWITGDPDTDKLLSDDPLALLVGMLLDQDL